MYTFRVFERGGLLVQLINRCIYDSLDFFVLYSIWVLFFALEAYLCGVTDEYEALKEDKSNIEDYAA